MKGERKLHGNKWFKSLLQVVAMMMLVDTRCNIIKLAERVVLERSFGEK